LYPDGRKKSQVDLGQLGGLTEATARYEGNTLTTYLSKKGKLFMTAKRIMNPGIFIIFPIALQVNLFTSNINAPAFLVYYVWLHSGLQ
jgi:hypothetical protein